MKLVLAIAGGIFIGGAAVFGWFVWAFKDVYR